MSDTGEKQSKKKLLSHPMMLIVAGAIFSSLLFPYITRQWQENEKELDLKSELIGDINEAVTKTTTAMALQRGPYGQNLTLSNMIPSITEWYVTKDVIGSKLDLYYSSDDQIARKWDNLSSVLTSAYRINSGVSLTHPENFQKGMCSRLGFTIKIHDILGRDPINIDPDVSTFFDCSRFYISELDQESWQLVKDGEINWNLPINDSEINWNSLFLWRYVYITDGEINWNIQYDVKARPEWNSFLKMIYNISNPSNRASASQANEEFGRNVNNLLSKVQGLKDDLLVDVSRYDLTVFKKPFWEDVYTWFVLKYLLSYSNMVHVLNGEK